MRLGEGEWRLDEEGESLISVLHTLLDDQSRKCCFNSKNHISSSVHKLIIENDAAGQRGGDEEEEQTEDPESNRTTTADLKLLKSN